MVKHLAKFLLAFALCYWLFDSGKLDFTLILKTFSLGVGWIWAAGILFLHYCATALRFKVLLQSKSMEKISFAKTFAFDAVGSFFSLILPGSAGADLVRFWYYRSIARDVSMTTKGSLLILDRFIGLFVLTLLSSIICFLQLDSLISLTPKFLLLTYFYMATTLGLGAVILFIFSDLISKEKLLIYISKYLKRFPKIEGIVIDMLSVRLNLKTFINCFIISLFNQGLVVLSFWFLILPFLPSHFSFLNFFTIVPLGLIGVALPISPVGLGVGHVVFDNLFKLFHINNGASLYNLYFVMNASFYLMGVFPYLLLKREDSK